MTSALYWYSVLVPQQDVATAFFAVVTFWSALQLQATKSPVFFYLGWIGLAGGMLSRGPFGAALTAGVLGAYVLLRRPSLAEIFGSAARALAHTAGGVLLFAALGLSWFAVEAARLGAAFVNLFFGSGAARYYSGHAAATGIALALGYVPLLIVAFLPWSGWLPGAIGLAVRQIRCRGPAARRERGERLFVLVWAGVGFLSLHVIA